MDKKDEVEQEVGMLDSVTSQMRNLRTLEERYSNIKKKMQLTDSLMMKEHKRLHSSVRSANSEILMLKKDLTELTYKMDLILKELTLSAKSVDLESLKKYIGIWQPMDFVRKDEVEKLVDEILKEK
jgi:hypothetical protein